MPFCKGLDVIQQAQSGTGKTATFCSGILQQLDYDLLECQALVLAPTRELAQQIEKVMRALGDYLGVKVHACVGGTSVREDQRILSCGVHVVVGTPGRVFDMLRRQSLPPNHIKMFVLDEADEMLSRGFKDQVFYLYFPSFSIIFNGLNIYFFSFCKFAVYILHIYIYLSNFPSINDKLKFKYIIKIFLMFMGLCACLVFLY